MILCIGATPAVQRVMVFEALALGAVNRAATTAEGAAGKSINVAKVLKVLGEEPLATGFLGGDRGEWLRSVLEAKGVRTDFVPVQVRTRECVTVIDRPAAKVTELVEESREVAGADYENLWQSITRHLPKAAAVVLSGTLTPKAPADFYARCVQAARAARALSVLDAKGPSLHEALKHQPGLVKPNRAELEATVGKPLADERAVMNAMRELQERGAERVVVTAGPEPTLALEGARVWKLESPAIQAVNPIGSGDAFTAALTWRLAKGDDLGQACRWGAAAGAANALSLLPGEVEWKDIEGVAKTLGKAQVVRSFC